MHELIDPEIHTDPAGVLVTRESFRDHFAVYIKVTNKDSRVFRVGSAGTSGNTAATHRRFFEKDAILDPKNLSEKFNRWKSIWVIGIKNGADGPIDRGFAKNRSLECFKTLAVEAFLIGQFARKYHFLDQSIFVSRQPVEDPAAFARDLIAYANGFSTEINEIIRCLCQ